MHMYQVSEHVNTYNQQNSWWFDAFYELMNIFEWFVNDTFYEIIKRGRKPLKPFIKNIQKRII